MNNNVDYIQICVACCQINKYNEKTLPFICPRTNMPCFAIKPDKLDSPEKINNLILYLKQLNPNEDDSENFRIPINCDCIDQYFVQTRCSAFEDLLKQGNTTILTMDAY